ncbi:MAG TPA: hypothetical protein ENJ13_03310 [Chromatiales bacterium]|nr:hypothetical protein [Chromatiales bacterium]
MDSNYPWYETVNSNSLEQGDIFRNYPVFSPEVTIEHIEVIAAGGEPTADVKVDTVDVIVLSQSCDLINRKVETVILCPLWALEDIEHDLGKNQKERNKRKEDIRQGKEPGWHMLSSDENVAQPISIVEFKRLYTTPKTVLSNFASAAGDRIRLMPPYREHLSQAFARYFMRVGLPNDIPSFK